MTRRGAVLTRVLLYFLFRLIMIHNVVWAAGLRYHLFPNRESAHTLDIRLFFDIRLQLGFFELRILGRVHRTANLAWNPINDGCDIQSLDRKGFCERIFTSKLHNNFLLLQQVHLRGADPLHLLLKILRSQHLHLLGFNC